MNEANPKQTPSTLLTGDGSEPSLPVIFSSSSVAELFGVSERHGRRILRAAGREELLIPAGPSRTGRPGRPHKLWRIP